MIRNIYTMVVTTLCVSVTPLVCCVRICIPMVISSLRAKRVYLGSARMNHRQLRRDSLDEGSSSRQFWVEWNKQINNSNYKQPPNGMLLVKRKKNDQVVVVVVGKSRQYFITTSVQQV